LEGALRCSGLLAAVVVASVCLAGIRPAEAGTPGKDGAKTVTAANTVVNCYAALGANAAAGATSVTVASAAALTCNGLSAMGPGDVVLIMQMQGASIDTTNTNNYGAITNYNSAGRYEFAVVGSVAGNVINFTGCGAGATTVTPLANAYVASTNGARTQVIRVPQYSTLTVTAPGSIVPTTWNGTAGGVVAIHVNATAALNSAGSINVSGRGFRGALHVTAPDATGFGISGYRATTYNFAGAEKGEGIVGDWNHYQTLGGAFQRGAPANGGGGANCENSGGGGGANGDNGGAWTGAGIKLPASVAWSLANEAADTESVSGGGRGGYSWLSNNQNELTVGPGVASWGGDGRRQVGGRGGRPVANDPAVRLFMGGGGGAGERNDCASGSDGGAGGGIVLLLANAVTGTGSILANGGVPPGPACVSDGAGGGGAGGTIVVSAATSGGITLSAVGAVGGNNIPLGFFNNVAMGPGGGGGGGYIAVSGGLGPGNVAGGVQGTDNSPRIPNFIQNGATQGAAGKTDVVASIPGGCFIPTRANFEGLRRDAAGTIEFAVTNLDATLGFRVHGMDQKGGARQLLSDGLIAVANEQRASSGPQYFSVPTRLDPKFILIEEVELSGASRWLGPFRSDDADNRRNYELTFAKRWVRMLDRGSRRPSLSVRSKPGGRARSPAPAAAVKIETLGEGYVSVPVADLTAAGMTANTSSWRLFNQGTAVPFAVVAGPAIRFSAVPLRSDYTSGNAYVVWQSSGAPPAPVVPITVSGPASPAGFTRIEQNAFYVPFNNPDADPWIWTFGTSATNSVSFDLPGYVPAARSRRIIVRLAGGSNHTHKVNLVLNGRVLGTATLAGRVPGQLNVTVPGSVLRAVGNELSFNDSPSGADPQSALVFLDRIDLDVALPAAGASVARIAPYNPSLGVSGQLDYLVLSPAAFLDSAQRLADGRRGTVASTAALDVERAYDTFSAGIVEPNAIRRALRNLRNQNGLKYVVLLGTDTTDPRNFQGDRPDDFIPSLLSYDDNYGRVPSEYLYSAVTVSGGPELAIGRLPARSPEEAEALVTKSLDSSRLLAGGGNRHVVVIDNNGVGENYSFEAEGKMQADAFPVGSTRAFVNLADGAEMAREKLSTELATGTQTLNFFGHGSLTYWADEQVMNADVASQLAGTDKGFVAFAWNCQSNLYDFAEPSLGETLLGVDDGGAVASLGPVGNTNPDFHHAFAQETYKQFLAGVPLGEAVRRARATLAPGTFKHVLNGWALLGDPLIRIP
jgi:hypothetical protein